MREPVERVINGRVVVVSPLPAMKALRLWPIVARGMGSGFVALSADEMQQVTKDLLATVRVDGREVMGETFNLDMAGDIDFVLSHLMPLAYEVNYGANGDFSAAADKSSTPAAPPSGESTS